MSAQFPSLGFRVCTYKPWLKTVARPWKHQEPAIARTVLDSARFGAQTTLASAHTTLKGVLRIRRDQQETPHALQEAELRSWLRFGEAYSAFAGLASHIRPLLASIPSCSVPEAKILPTTRDTELPCPATATTWLNVALTKHRV